MSQDRPTIADLKDGIDRILGLASATRWFGMGE